MLLKLASKCGSVCFSIDELKQSWMIDRTTSLFSAASPGAFDS